MSKNRNNTPYTTYQAPNFDNPEPQKKGISKKWKIGGAVVAGLVVIGIFAPTDAEQTDASATATATTTTAPEEDAVQGDPTPPDVESIDAPEPTPAAAPAPAQAEEKKSGHTLRFEANTSDGSTGSVTYVGQDFNIIQHQDEPMPWGVDIDGIGNKWDAIGANISVQQNGGDEVTCRALWDGEVVSENTSTGDYAIAMCSLPTGF